VIEIKDVIACGNKGVVEWAFTETRKSDGWTHTMDDAIVFRLRDDGAILYWREYFDPAQ
jgi:ketosteroid isomerase-like protein